MVARASYRVGEAVASNVSTSGKIDCILPSGTGFYVGRRDKGGNFFMHSLNFNFAERQVGDNERVQQEGGINIIYSPENDASQECSSPKGLVHQGKNIGGQPLGQSYLFEPIQKKQLGIPRGYVHGRARNKLVFEGKGDTYWAKPSDVRVRANRAIAGQKSTHPNESYQDFLAGFYGYHPPQPAERAVIKGH